MAHDNDEIGPQEFAGAEVHACECDVCMKMTACTNYSGAMECRNCLADNFLMGGGARQQRSGTMGEVGSSRVRFSRPR
jgi:ribosomal protein L40E